MGQRLASELSAASLREAAFRARDQRAISHSNSGRWRECFPSGHFCSVVTPCIPRLYVLRRAGTQGKHGKTILGSLRDFHGHNLSSRDSEDIFLFGPSSGAVATFLQNAADTWESSDSPSRDAGRVINERPAELRTSELAENGKSPLNCR